MTDRLYATYEHSNKFVERPMLDDWNIKRDWNKVGSLTFKSPDKLIPGTHVKLISPNHKNFAGQVVKRSEKANDFYSYDCLDYKRYLLTEVNYSGSGSKRSSDILNYVKKYVSSPIKFKITKTKNLFSNLVFSDKTVLEIISQLINLEFKKGTLIYFDVDENANLTFKPYPSTMKGYSLDSAISYNNSIDYSDIATSYAISEGTENKSTTSNKNLVNIWGNINLMSVIEKTNNNNNNDNDSNIQSNESLSDSEIKKIVKQINKSFRSYKHTHSGGNCDCFCMSDKIFAKLKSNKIPCKILSYYSSSASSGTHRTVVVKYKSGWKDFDYSGMDKWYNAMSTKRNKKTIKEYKG